MSNKAFVSKFIASTRWEYYVANIAGIAVILGVLVWSVMRIIAGGGVDPASVFFWLALSLLVLLPYTLIGFLSSMKAVEVTAKHLAISYVFHKHVNLIPFTEIAGVRGQRTSKGKRSFRETFTIVLHDGRAFEFDRAQLNGYDKLKAACVKAEKKR